jgi:hypothetical protein
MFEIVAGMSGVFVWNLTPLRMFVSLAIFGVWLALTLSDVQPSFTFVAGVFAALFVLRYLFLFRSFTPEGIAAQLKRRFGRELGFSIYEAVTAVFFAARALSFAWLLNATPIETAPFVRDVLITLGAVLAVIGMVINIWAAWIVGLRTYYYRDLFMGERLAPGEFKVEGPYRFFKNPMYGVGQLAAYGAALMALSPLGVLVSAFNQLAMYVFNWLIEQPHIEAASGPANTA